MRKNPRLEKRRSEVSEDVKAFVDKSFQIVDQINIYLHQQGLTQKDFAKMLGKEESEISKWMSGVHNFTLKTLAKIEGVLGQPVIGCPKDVNKEYNIFLFEASSSFHLKTSIEKLPELEMSVTQDVYASANTSIINSNLCQLN